MLMDSSHWLPSLPPSTCAAKQFPAHARTDQDWITQCLSKAGITAL